MYQLHTNRKIEMITLTKFFIKSGESDLRVIHTCNGILFTTSFDSYELSFMNLEDAEAYLDRHIDEIEKQGFKVTGIAELELVQTIKHHDYVRTKNINE